MPGQRADRLQADRAGFTGPQVLGQRVGGVRLVRRFPGGAGLPGFLLSGLEVEYERVISIPCGGQLILLCLEPRGEGALLLVSTCQRIHMILSGQHAAGPFGLIFGLGRVVGLLRPGRDPLVGGGDPVGQVRHADWHADGGQQPGLGAHGVGLLGRLAGLLGTLAKGTQPVVDGLPERAQVPFAGGGPLLGFRGGVGELAPLLQRQPGSFGRQPRPLPGLLPDLLVDAEREQFDEQLLALARLGLEEVGEPALRQQHRLDEVVIFEPEDVPNPCLDRVGAFGEVLDGGAEEVGQRRVRGDSRVEQVEPGLPGVHLAPFVAGQRPHRGVTPTARLEDQADPARAGRGGQGMGDHVLLAPPGHGAVQGEAQAVNQRALA